MSKKHQLVIVDDQPIILSGLTGLINAQPDLAVTAALSGSRNILAWTEKNASDLLIMDLALGNADGLDLIKSLRSRHENLPILIFTKLDERECAPRALHAGAQGYVMKNQTTDVLLEAIRTVLEGKTFVSESVRNLSEQPDPERHGVESLTDREFSIFGMLGRGLSTREIATELHLSTKTVEKHRENIKARLNLNNTSKLVTEAAKWFWRNRE